MISYEQFFPYVQIHVSDAPEPLVLATVRNTCIEFCRDTLWLQQDIDPTSVQAGTNPYEIDVPTGHKLLQILSLYYDGNRLYPLAQLTANNASLTNWQQLSGTPLYYTALVPTEITLVPTPDVTLANALTGRMALAPTRDSTTVDDTLYNEFVEDIAAGAAGKLKLVSGYKFSDPNDAAIKIAAFRSAVGRTKIRVNAGLVQASLTVQMR